MLLEPHQTITAIWTSQFPLSTCVWNLSEQAHDPDHDGQALHDHHPHSSPFISWSSGSSEHRLGHHIATTFEKFFRIKNLIDNINIKHFRALQGVKDKGGAPEIETIEDASSDKVAETEEPVLTEIDLTEEAISNDQVVKRYP